MKQCATHKKNTDVSQTTAFKHSKMRWLMGVGVLLVIILAYWVYDRNRQQQSLELVEAVTQVDTAQGPRFEFYSLLAESAEIAEPVEALEKQEIIETQKNLETDEVLIAEDSYMLQVASLQDVDDAYDYQAILMDQGFATEITTFIDGHGTTWYRIRVGPYADKHAAETAQQQLAQRGIAGIIHKENV